jgi:hypothetical protein
MLRRRLYGQHSASFAVGMQTPSPEDDALAILPYDLEAAIPKCGEPRTRIQQLASIIKPVAAVRLKSAPSTDRKEVVCHS